MNKLFLIALFLFSMSLPSYAQFIGIRIGIPGMSVYGVGAGGGGSNNYIQDDAGHNLNDDASHYLIAG
jgi:hypothetical protein